MLSRQFLAILEGVLEHRNGNETHTHTHARGAQKSEVFQG